MTNEQVNCDGNNRYGIECPMRLSCRHFTVRVDDAQWFSFAPFYGHVDDEKAYFSCDHYENNGGRLPSE